MWQNVFDITKDAVLDSLMVLPFLLAMYVLIEIYEYRQSAKLKVDKMLGGALAPLLGGAVGLIPQCGFSVVATKLYSKRKIRVGTLLAVYVATSDEAIPVLISNPSSALKLLPLLLIKFLFALLIGYGVNFVLRKKEKIEKTAEGGGESYPLQHCNHEHNHSGNEAPDGESLSQKESGKRFDWERFLFGPILHSLKILLYIFIVNLIFGVILFFAGEERLFEFMNNSLYFQPLVAAVVGLIPNCASSVVISRMFSVGALSLGAAVAGLSVNAGIAFAVLFKENKNLKNNLLILLTLFVSSILVGTLITVIFPAL